jgi:hypothetical protein
MHSATPSVGTLLSVPSTSRRASYPLLRGVCGLARVRGRSMQPSLHPGDLLLVRYGAPVRPGRLVLARFPNGVLTVKRAVEARETRSGEPGWWLLSDNPELGVDSRHRGVIPEADVVATVVGRVEGALPAVARWWSRPHVV